MKKKKRWLTFDVKFTPMRWVIFIGVVAIVGWLIGGSVENNPTLVGGIVGGIVGTIIFTFWYYKDNKKQNLRKKLKEGK